MPRSPLNPRQREVRKIYVKERGLITTTEIADRIGCDRTTVWRDLKVIAKHKPVPVDDYVEQKEIDEALAGFDIMARGIEDDIQEVQVEIGRHAGTGTAIGFLNVKANLLGQLRALQAERRDFLLKIGYLTEEPKRISLEKPLSEIQTDEQIKDALEEIGDQIKELEATVGGGEGQAGSG